MDARSFSRLLAPLAGAVLAGGWALAVVAFFIIGTERCSEVDVPLAGPIQACQDTSASAVILLTVIGFAATVGALFLWALRYLIIILSDIEANTHPEER